VERFVHKQGQLDEPLMAQIAKGLEAVLEIGD
jgi:hypothetical protein